MYDSIKICNLNAGWNKKPVLKNINFSISKGEFICLSGPNGSGKSTLLSIIAGIQKEAVFGKPEDSVPILKVKQKERARIISYMQQNESSTWNYKAKDIILTGRFPHTNFTGFYSDKDFMVTDKIIRKMGIEESAEKNVFELSGGEFQKIRIARCLVQETDFILLDEPTAGLDFTYQEELLSLLKSMAKENNTGILISIHDINTAARFAEKLILLPKLKPCISGPVEQIMTESNLAVTYGAEIKICTHPIYKCPMAVF